MDSKEVIQEKFAYVRYRLDDVKAKVPISYILDFDANKVWSKSKQYKVFWSNEKDDSPALLRQRAPSDQVVESKEDPNYGKAAFYRATIYCVAG